MDFAKGQRKDDVMHEHLAAFEAAGRRGGGVHRAGAGEDPAVPHRETPRPGASYPWIVKTTGVVNHFYFYCLDADFGPFFLKFCSYFPYNAKLCLNGNEWAKRQATKAGIEFTHWTTASPPSADPAAVQADLRPTGTRADRRAAAQVARPAAAPVHPRRPGSRLPL